MLRKQFPTAVPVMEAARDDVLAFLHFPQEHWRKVWSTNPGLIQSVSQACLQRLRAWVEVGWIALSQCLRASLPQPISI